MSMEWFMLRPSPERSQRGLELRRDGAPSTSLRNSWAGEPLVCPVASRRSSIPGAGGIWIALILHVQAAIIAIEVAVRLHPARKIERASIFTCYSELDVCGRVDGPGEGAAARMRLVYREMAADIALTWLLLNRKSHICGDVVCCIINCTVVIAGHIWVGVRRRRRRWCSRGRRARCWA